MDKREWHMDGGSGVSMESRNGDSVASDEEATPITDAVELEDLGTPDSSAPPAEPGVLLGTFDELAVRLGAGAETVNELRGRVEELLETSAEMSRDLAAHRRRLEADEEARRRDHASIARLEEELASQTQIVTDMRGRLGDLVRDFEAIA